MHEKRSTLSLIPSKSEARRPRANPRAPVNRRAVILLPDTGRPHPVLLCDVSAGGACIQSDTELAAGDEIVMRAELAAGIQLTLRASVVGVRRRNRTPYTHYGLRFTGMSDAEAKLVKVFVAASGAGAPPQA